LNEFQTQKKRGNCLVVCPTRWGLRIT